MTIDFHDHVPFKTLTIAGSDSGGYETIRSRTYSLVLFMCIGSFFLFLPTTVFHGQGSDCKICLVPSFSFAHQHQFPLHNHNRGAGIQADLKTFTSLETFGTSVITSVTSQNTLAVDGIHPIPAAFVAQQLEAVLSDIGTDAIKTGNLLTLSCR
jgi:hypothetical protein